MQQVEYVDASSHEFEKRAFRITIVDGSPLSMTDV
jgi:hypothetical protein